jgi:hypothetical protein
MKVADRPPERGRRHRRLVWKIRTPTAIQRVDEKRKVMVSDAPSVRLILPIKASANPAFVDRKSPSACRASCARSMSKAN